MTINEINRIRKLMGYTFEDLAGVSGLPAEHVQLMLAPAPADISRLEAAVLTLIRRDEATGNVIHEEVLPYVTGRNADRPC